MIPGDALFLLQKYMESSRWHGSRANQRMWKLTRLLSDSFQINSISPSFKEACMVEVSSQGGFQVHFVLNFRIYISIFFSSRPHIQGVLFFYSQSNPFGQCYKVLILSGFHSMLQWLFGLCEECLGIHHEKFKGYKKANFSAVSQLVVVKKHFIFSLTHDLFEWTTAFNVRESLE